MATKKRRPQGDAPHLPAIIAPAAPPAEGAATSTGEKPFGAADLKEQVALLALVVLFVGLISTEAYYAEFGVRYQDLGLPVTHFVYRGLTTLVNAYAIAALYVLAALWLFLLDALHTRISRPRAVGGTYVLVVLLLVTGYPLARSAGLREARKDMTYGDSRLPTVECLVSAEGSCRPEYRRFRYLVTANGQIMIFLPVQRTQTATYPVIVHLPQGDVHEMRTTR